MKQTLQKAKVFAIEHAFGISLVQAMHGAEAISLTKAEFGNAGYPYKLPADQESSIAWAKSMGARVL